MYMSSGHLKLSLAKGAGRGQPDPAATKWYCQMLLGLGKEKALDYSDMG